MKVFTVIVTEIERNVWRKEITAANEDEAYDNFASGLDEVTVDVIEK